MSPAPAAGPDVVGRRGPRESVVKPAKRSPQAEKKARTPRPAAAGRALSYAGLIEHRSGLCRNRVELTFARGQSNRFTLMPEQTPTQTKAFELLNIKVT